jgi:hypothetical protein
VTAGLNCEPDVLHEDLWVHGSSHPLPDGTPPSCRYLPLRVLTWLRYDAHWLRQASDVRHPRGPRHNHRTEVCTSILYPLRGFSRLQGSACTFIGLGPTPSQVSPLSAPPSPDMTNRVPALPLSVLRFSQPLDRTYAVNDLRVYSTPLALLG